MVNIEIKPSIGLPLLHNRLRIIRNPNSMEILVGLHYFKNCRRLYGLTQFSGQ